MLIDTANERQEARFVYIVPRTSQISMDFCAEDFDVSVVEGQVPHVNHLCHNRQHSLHHCAANTLMRNTSWNSNRSKYMAKKYGERIVLNFYIWQYIEQWTDLQGSCRDRRWAESRAPREWSTREDSAHTARSGTRSALQSARAPHSTAAKRPVCPAFPSWVSAQHKKKCLVIE